MTTHTTSPTVPDAWSRELKTQAERYASGKALREKASRSSQAEWVPDPARPDPISLLEEANKTRLENLVPIRFGRMSLSPFAFYRGTADIMAYDLAKSPVSGIQVQLCGDAHLSNFGAFASPERTLVFDVNDFDETLEGPWEWDVKRLAASIVLASRQNGYTAQESRKAVLSCLQYYRQYMQRFASMNYLDVWYYNIDVDYILSMISSMKGSKKLQKNVQRYEKKASRRTRIEAFPKLAEVVDGKYRIKDEPPLIYHYDPLHPNKDDLKTDEWRELVKEYLWSLRNEIRTIVLRYRAADVAQKVVGVGSVGTRCAIVLALGGAEGNDPLFIQFKEVSASALEQYVGGQSLSSPWTARSDRAAHDAGTK